MIAQVTSTEPVASAQPIVALLAAHAVRVEPSAAHAPRGHVGARRPLTGARTMLPVLSRAHDAGGHVWLRVRLPGRAQGRAALPPSGWISSTGTVSMSTVWHIVVDVGARRVDFYRDGRLRRSFRAIVGKPSTPTPRGEFFVEENVRLSASRAGAPYALATSARSRVLQEFDGGPGQIAVHGLANLGGQPGTAVSHGCVRLTAKAISWAAARIRPGVPVSVV